MNIEAKIYNKNKKNSYYFFLLANLNHTCQQIADGMIEINRIMKRQALGIAH